MKGARVAFLGRYEDRLSDSGTCTVAFTQHTGRIYPVVCRGNRISMQFTNPHDWYVLEI